MSEVIHGFGATISVNDGASNAQAAFASLASCNIPFGDVAIHKFANLAGGDRNLLKSVGMIDQGQFTFEIAYSVSDYGRLVAVKGLKYITGSTATTWKVTAPADAAGTIEHATFAAILTKCDAELGDNIVVIKCTAEVWGTITLS